MAAASASTVCPLLIAATLLGFYSLISVVHCQNLHTDCSIQHPVRLTRNSMGGTCTVNNNTAAIQNCTSYCLNLSHKVGALDSSSQCICSDVATFDLNYCCSDIQCPAACDFQNIYCNQATHQCEANVTIVDIVLLVAQLAQLSPSGVANLLQQLTANCSSTCTRNGFESGTFSSLLGCTCKGCSGITNAGPDACNRVSNALWGVFATSAGNSTCMIMAGSAMNSTDLCDHINRLNNFGSSN